MGKTLGNQRWDNDRLDSLLKGTNLTRLTTVIKSDTKVKFKCKECNHTFYAIAYNFDRANKKNCPKCNQNKKQGKSRLNHTYNDVVQILQDKNLTLLSDTFINSNTKLIVQCNKCKKITHRTLRSIVASKYACKECKGGK